MAYRGRSQLLTGPDGWIRGGSDGFWLDSTRFLSRMELVVDGMAPTPTGVGVVGRTRIEAYYVAAPYGPIYDRRLILSARHQLADGLSSRYQLNNYDPDASHRLDLALRIATDFVDRRALDEEGPGATDTIWDRGRRELRIELQHISLNRAVRVRTLDTSRDWHWKDNALHLEIELPPGGSFEVGLVAEPVIDGDVRAAGPLPVGTREYEAEGRPAFAREPPSLQAASPAVARAWKVAVGDLISLPLDLDDAPATPAAGLPLYQEYYSRDALTTAWQALPVAPELMRDALRYAAATLGRHIDDFYDEEPGKTLARERWGPHSLLRKDPFARHFGDYAAPCDFLIMLGQYLAWTDDVATVRTLRPAAREVLDWLERYGDRDGDGFIEYSTRVRNDLRPPVKNQGWKDSPSAMPDAGGREVENPIATSELQGYLYAGLHQAATVFARLGDVGFAYDLMIRARRLKRRFDEAFWMNEASFYAAALGPDKRPIRSVGSNPAHLLATGIVPRRRAAVVADRLMRPDMFSGWGVRTLSSDHPAYNPFSYHLGSVWPVEQGTFALGVARYGLTTALHRVAEGLFAASELFVGGRLPEAIGGLPRDAAHAHPGIYPGANDLQGWSSGAVVIMVQSLLGLRPLGAARAILADPHLPAWLPWLHVRGIRVANGTVDIEAWRGRSGRTRMRARATGVRVLRLPASKRFSAGTFGRSPFRREIGDSR